MANGPISLDISCTLKAAGGVAADRPIKSDVSQLVSGWKLRYFSSGARFGRPRGTAEGPISLLGITSPTSSSKFGSSALNATVVAYPGFVSHPDSILAAFSPPFSLGAPPRDSQYLCPDCGMLLPFDSFLLTSIIECHEGVVCHAKPDLFENHVGSPREIMPQPYSTPDEL